MPTPLIDYVGLTAGVAGISIALYLQMVVRHRVPTRLILRFALAGLALVAMSSDAILGTDVLFYEMLRVFVYITLIALEVTGLTAVRDYFVAYSKLKEIVPEDTL